MAASARGGILVIQEPARLSPYDQARLAQVIEHEGDAVRLVTIATRDLADLVAARALSPALAQLLAGVSVVVPPLRARLHELPGIVEALVEEIAAESGRPVPRMDPSALTALARHSWPGNVRELRDVLKRAVLSSRSRYITAADVDPSAAVDRSASSTDGILDLSAAVAERARIVEALRACHGNQTRAAKMLGISRGTLISRLDRFGLPRPRK